MINDMIWSSLNIYVFCSVLPAVPWDSKFRFLFISVIVAYKSIIHKKATLVKNFKHLVETKCYYFHMYVTIYIFYKLIKKHAPFQRAQLWSRHRHRASCNRTVTQRAEVIFADLMFRSTVFTHAAHPELVFLDRQTSHNAHGYFPFHPREEK